MRYYSRLTASLSHRLTHRPILRAHSARMIRFACPSCSRIFKTAEENAGKRILCQICKQPVQIPPPVRKAMLGIAVSEKAIIAQEEPVAVSAEPTLAPIEEEIVAKDFQFA